MTNLTFSSKQKRLIKWWSLPDTKDKDGVIAEGSVRSGKTWAMITGFVLWSMHTFSNCSFIIAGKTINSLARNVVVPMQQILKLMGFPFFYNRSFNFVQIGTNTYFLFGANGEASQDVLQGMTAAGCLLDEVALMPRSFVEQAIARCSVEGSRLWFNCNPSFPTHYVKTEYIDKADEKNLLVMKFNMQDNPTLSASIRERFERMYSGVFYDRFIRGLWVLAEGLVYGDYASGELEEDCVATAKDICYITIDYGISNPFVALLWTVRDGVAYCCDEYSYDGRAEGRKTDDEHYEAVAELAKNYYVETIVVDPSANSFIEKVRRVGVYDVRGADNAVKDGIAKTLVAMKSGCLRVSPRCKTVIQELGLYSWNPKSKEDAVIKENDHAMDAMRYFVNTIGVRVLKCFE